jgi:hypothetical protein
MTTQYTLPEIQEQVDHWIQTVGKGKEKLKNEP